jgi:uncharacterized membrane-anchored protein
VAQFLASVSNAVSPRRLYGRMLRRMAASLLVLCVAAGVALSARAQEPATKEEPKIKIDWQQGPTTGKLGDIAEIAVPEGYLFTDKAGAEKILQMTQNIPSGRELGALVGKDSGWFMIFEFEDSGYVKDEEGSSLDAEKILKSLQDGTEEANSERAKRGWRPIHVTGWQHPPYYDAQTHNLTWATLVRGDDPQDSGSVNHSIRILGRRGTMNVDLVAGPGEYANLTGKFNSLMADFHYTQGNRYSEFAKGDKVAEYGLTALIVGGGAAVALKTGLFAKLGVLLLKLWKFILMGLVALGAAIKKVIQAIFGKEEKIEDPNEQAASQGR